MKNLIPAIALLFVMASCSDRFSIMKRRYQKGYYVTLTPKAAPEKEKKQTAAAHRNRAEPVAVQVAAEPEGNREEAAGRSVATTPIFRHVPGSPAGEQHSAPKVLSRKQHPAVASAAGPTASELRQVRELLQKLPPAAGNSAVDSDVMFVILVVLALILPPLAVYLKDQQLNKWFWLTLILWLFWFSFFVNPFGGLMWLAAAVIALLYVFEVIK